jgi:hypothetical protein
LRKKFLKWTAKPEITQPSLLARTPTMSQSSKGFRKKIRKGEKRVHEAVGELKERERELQLRESEEAKENEQASGC